MAKHQVCPQLGHVTLKLAKDFEQDAAVCSDKRKCPRKKNRGRVSQTCWTQKIKET
jgi:hypothetical protein